MTNFKAKMHQIRFRLGLHPRPCWGAYSAPQTPLLDLGAASRQGEGLGWGRGGKEGGEGEEGGSGGEGREGPQVTVEPGPLRDLLRH